MEELTTIPHISLPSFNCILFIPFQNAKFRSSANEASKEFRNPFVRDFRSMTWAPACFRPSPERGKPMSASVRALSGRRIWRAVRMEESGGGDRRLCYAAAD